MLHYGEDVGLGLGGGLVFGIWRDFKRVEIILIEHFREEVVI